MKTLHEISSADWFNGLDISTKPIETSEKTKQALIAFLYKKRAKAAVKQLKSLL